MGFRFSHRLLLVFGMVINWVDFSCLVLTITLANLMLPGRPICITCPYLHKMLTDVDLLRDMNHSRAPYDGVANQDNDSVS